MPVPPVEVGLKKVSLIDADFLGLLCSPKVVFLCVFTV